MNTAEQPNPPDLFSHITTQIFQLNGLLLAWGDQFCADLNLTSARWQMLGALHLAEEPQTSPQLADRMGMTRQGSQKQLNLLLADGLVETIENPAHKRSSLYTLTPQGQAVYHKIHQRWHQQINNWSTGLKMDDLQTTEKILNHLTVQIKSNPAD